MAVPLPTPTLVIFVALLVIALEDLLTFKILNLFTLPLLASGLAYHAMFGDHGAFWESLVGALLGFGLLIPFYILGGMGGGDVKLMAAVGAWLGPVVTTALILASCLAAGCYAAVVLVASRRGKEVWINVKVALLRVRALSRSLGSDDEIEAEPTHPHRYRRSVPFAAMVAIGFFALLLLARYLPRR